MATSSIVYQPIRLVELPTKELATVDIDEPIQLIRGGNKRVEYRCFTGDPVSDRFIMEFYRTENEAEQGINQLTADLPIYQLSPHKPYPFPNLHFEGTASFFVPYDWVYFEMWGKLIIVQPKLKRYEKGTPKMQKLNTYNKNNRKALIPVWER